MSTFEKAEEQEIDEALKRQAIPSHEQDTIEFDSRSVIEGLAELELVSEEPEPLL